MSLPKSVASFQQGHGYTGSFDTQMFQACCEGRLDVLKCLHSLGASLSIKTTNQQLGDTLMCVACEKGHLHMAQWLFKFGVASDIWTRGNGGFTPLFNACRCGHLHVVQWLVAVGSDIHTTSDHGDTPLHVSFLHGHINCMEWLVLEGAANAKTGHVSQEILSRDVFAGPHALSLRGRLQLVIELNRQLRHLLLPAVYCQQHASSYQSKSNCTTDSKKVLTRSCLLHRFCGVSSSIFPIVADFLGVVRGRKLRNVREAIQFLS